MSDRPEACCSRRQRRLIDLPPAERQQQLVGPGQECCARRQSHAAAMPQRYQNDSPFRGLQEQQDLPMVSPQRVDSLAKSNVKLKGSTIQAVDILKQVPWFQPDMQRERVIEILSKEEIGTFIVRNSSTHPGCFALSVKVPKFDNPTGIGHYLIQRTPAGSVRIKGLDKEWSSLAALVVHHTIMPELLPCTLVMPEGASRNPCASAANDDYDNSNAYGSTAACAAAALRARPTPSRGSFATCGSTPMDGAFSGLSGEMKLK